MLKERILIGSAAILMGIVLSAGVFYLWQSTKVIPNSQQGLEENETPTPTPSPFLIIENPTDESVVDKRIVQVSGRALNTKQVIISSKTQDLVIEPATDGSFATNVTLSEGVNSIHVLAILKNGESVAQTISVTFTTETF